MYFPDFGFGFDVFGVEDENFGVGKNDILEFFFYLLDLLSSFTLKLLNERACLKSLFFPPDVDDSDNVFSLSKEGVFPFLFYEVLGEGG